LLSSMRQWFKWMTRQNHILHNPASEIELPKAGDYLPRNVLTVQEAELVLQQPDISVPLGLRDRAMMEVLYATGMRRMELANLKLPDVNFDGRVVRIRQGKGRKDRVVPIGKRAVAWMLKYINEARPQLVSEPDDYTIFLTYTGEALDLGHITAFVHDYVDKAQIGKTGSAHMFRHTMATLMLEGGANVRYVQQMLGHASLVTTGKYLRVAITKLQKVYEATHPGANLEPSKGQPGEAQRKASRAELVAALRNESDDEDEVLEIGDEELEMEIDDEEDEEEFFS
ncbi:MAG: tyrosine-type recombinase/integrase, partial [Acidobacteriaceae bacterium]|nr:tyrosine-type recombinase/integrase [Acidobacteriaceae bacterium]